MKFSLVLLVVVSFCSSPFGVIAIEESKTTADSEAPTCSWSTDPNCDDDMAPRVPPDCTVVLAPSSLHGYGLFTLKDFRRGQAVLPGDVVLHMSDPIRQQQSTVFAATHYWWSSSDTAGWSEGPAAVAPGVGMAANGDPHHSNVLPAVPAVDEAGLTRTDSPGAGAVSIYHNWTWYVQSQQLPAGSELIVHYGPQWFAERQFPTEEEPHLPALVPAGSLRQTGWCVDQLRPGQSLLRDAGRGAFARRYLPVGAVVAPVPVLTVLRESLNSIQKKKQRRELLLNYCWGHPESSLLMYSYGPLVNLINHSGGKRANVRLQWVDPVHNITIAQALERPFLLELVAIRPIRKDEEVVLDYGLPWIEAWLRHVQQWRPADTEPYAPSYVMNDAIQVLRTQDELKSHPYPPNVYTSCYYRYDPPKDDAATAKSQKETSDTTTAVRWVMQRGVFAPRHLRPCRVLQRHEAGSQLHFTVQLQNRPGLTPLLPDGGIHIITHVPRHAVTFSDRPYTTDAYLPQAFRYPMGNLEFPEQWKDLKEQRTDGTENE